LASENPSTRVVAVDELSNLIEIARQIPGNPANLEFVKSTYSAMSEHPDRFALLVCACGIDFRADYIEAFQTEALANFTSWSSVVCQNAVLRTVLRLPAFEHLIATVNAAAEAGWQVNLESSTIVRAGQELFPGLSFVAMPHGTTRLPDRSILWKWHTERRSKYGCAP
jgi:hypothetical protein